MAAPVSPWTLGGLGVGELARDLWNEFSADEALDRAAALAYYFLFALFPALLFLTSLIGMLPIPGLMNQLMGYVAQTLPPDAASMIQRTLDEVVAGAGGGLLSVGAMAALWAASTGMVSIMAALNVAYNVEDPRPWWKRRLVAIGLTVGFSIFIVAALVLIVFGPRIAGMIAGRLGLGGVFTAVWNIVSVPAVILFVLIGIALVYFFAPASGQTWRWVTPGSAVALVLWLAMSLGLRVYVTNFGDYSATYGSIGGVILLMLWFYLTGVALLLGAEINAVVERAAARRGAADAKAPGEREAGGDGPGVRPGPDTRPAAAPPPPRTPLEEDVAVAGRIVADRIEEWRRRGLMPLFMLGAAAVAGWMLRRRPVTEVADTSRTAIETGLQVAAAIAAAERFRHRKAPHDRRQRRAA